MEILEVLLGWSKRFVLAWLLFFSLESYGCQSFLLEEEFKKQDKAYSSNWKPLFDKKSLKAIREGNRVIKINLDSSNLREVLSTLQAGPYLLDIQYENLNFPIFHFHKIPNDYTLPRRASFRVFFFNGYTLQTVDSATIQRSSYCRFLDISAYHIPDITPALNDKGVWYSGALGSNLQSIYADIISKILEAEEIPQRNVLFMGSSMGGFMALKMAGYFPEASVLVYNPQVNLIPFLKERFLLSHEIVSVTAHLLRFDIPGTRLPEPVKHEIRTKIDGHLETFVIEQYSKEPAFFCSLPKLIPLIGDQSTLTMLLNSINTKMRTTLVPRFGVDFELPLIESKPLFRVEFIPPLPPVVFDLQALKFDQQSIGDDLSELAVLQIMLRWMKTTLTTLLANYYTLQEVFERLHRIVTVDISSQPYTLKLVEKPQLTSEQKDLLFGLPDLKKQHKNALILCTTNLLGLKAAVVGPSSNDIVDTMLKPLKGIAGGFVTSIKEFVRKKVEFVGEQLIDPLLDLYWKSIADVLLGLLESPELSEFQERICIDPSLIVLANSQSRRFILYVQNMADKCHYKGQYFPFLKRLKDETALPPLLGSRELKPIPWDLLELRILNSGFNFFTFRNEEFGHHANIKVDQVLLNLALMNLERMSFEELPPPAAEPPNPDTPGEPRADDPEKTGSEPPEAGAHSDDEPSSSSPS
jgi:hypothetical protein